MCVHVCHTCVLCFYFCKCMCVVYVLCLCISFVCMFVSVCLRECLCVCACFRSNGRSQGNQEDLAAFGLCLVLPAYPWAGCSVSLTFLLRNLTR